MVAETSQTLDRGLTVLEVLSDTPEGLTVTELAARLGVSRTVVYRLVVTLEQHALLRRGPDGRCRLGLGLLPLARQVQPAVREAAVPSLRRLADSTGALAYLAVVDGVDSVVAAVAEPTRSEAAALLRPGARLPLERGAVGRALLAAREETADPSVPVVSSTEVHPGASGAAAALVGVAGIEAAVGVLVLGELADADVAPKVARAAADIARALR
jgi:DNA-binding IclR family transcriptional regulator